MKTDEARGHHNPEQHRHREALDGRAAPDGHRQHGQEGRRRRVETAREGLVDAEIDELAKRHRLVATQVLAHAIVDNHLVVDRIADQRQHRSDSRETEVQARQREEAHRLRHVENQRRDGADGELPLEPDPDVGEHGEAREHDRQDTGSGELAAHLGADDFDAREVCARLKLDDRRFDGSMASPARFVTGLHLHANQGRCRIAELLQRHLAQAKAIETSTQAREVCRLLGLDLDQLPPLKSTP